MKHRSKGTKILPYCWCLSCFAPLPAFKKRPSVECTHCGKINLRVDMGVFWSQDRDMRQWEAALKTVILVGCAYLTWRASGGAHSGWAAGYYIAIPLIAAMALWETVSQLTRFPRYFRPKILWTAATLVGGYPIALVLVAVGVDALARSSWSSAAWVLSVALVLFSLPLFVHLAGRAFVRWRDARVRRRSQSTLVTASS